MIKANLLVLERNLVKVKGTPYIRRGYTHYPRRVCPLFAEGIPNIRIGCTQYPQRVYLHRITRQVREENMIIPLILCLGYTLYARKL